MATFTTNYNFGLPTVGGDKNAWGQLLNTNWNSIDTLLKTATDTANSSVQKSGSTMTGLLTLSADPSNALHASTKQYVDTADTALSTRVTTAQTQADNAIANAALAQTTADNKVPSVGAAIKTGAFTISGGDLTVLSGQAYIGGGKVQGTGTEIGFYNNAGAIGCRMTLSNGDFTTSGQVYAFGNVTAASDARLKTNVEQIRDALTLVNRMRGVFYKRVDTDENQVGVIAQEMQEVIPQVVSENADGMLGVSYGNLTAVLIEAVKELSERLDKIEAR